MEQLKLSPRTYFRYLSEAFDRDWELLDQENDNAALLGFLSDNYLNRVQNNTVFPTQEEMDRVVFEPTTSAMQTNK
jgi:hypothetical protein